MAADPSTAARGPIASSTLRLEPLVVAHAEEMFEPLSAAAMYDYMPGGPPSSPAALRERYVQLARGRSADGSQQWLNWIVRLNSGHCAGFVQATIYPELTGDFAFAFSPRYWGRGVAIEACQAALPYLARERRVTALFATVDPQNARSLRLLVRLGFRDVPPAQYPHGEVEPNDRVFSLSLTASA
ncbi:MAG: GNAT family N-acetyltransferase [Burkholderiales bacterium]